MDLTQFVEHHGGISVIRGGETVRSWNGIQYQAGLSAKNVNVKQLSMNVATVPPGAVAYAHVHVGFEVMLYILHGRVRHEFGDHLKQSVENQAGDFIYIKPGVPHEVWYPDAATISRRVQLARERGLGIGFWRLGREDQRIWDDPQIAPGTAWP